MLKTFMHGHLCMMTFLHLKVQCGWCEFSLGSVSSSPCHCILGSVSTFKRGYAQNIYAWSPFCTRVKSAKKISQNRLTHLCVAVVNRLGNSSSHQKQGAQDRISWSVSNNITPTMLTKSSWIMHPWFCVIDLLHLIRRKYFYFEKNENLKFLTCRSILSDQRFPQRRFSER